MQRLSLSVFLLKLTTDAKALDLYQQMDKKGREAFMAYEGLDSVQQDVVLSGDTERVLTALKEELKGVVELVDGHIMETSFFG